MNGRFLVWTLAVFCKRLVLFLVAWFFFSSVWSDQWSSGNWPHPRDAHLVPWPLTGGGETAYMQRFDEIWYATAVGLLSAWCARAIVRRHGQPRRGERMVAAPSERASSPCGSRRGHEVDLIALRVGW